MTRHGRPALRLQCIALISATIVSSIGVGSAQVTSRVPVSPERTYWQPNATITALVDRPPFPPLSSSADGRTLVLANLKGLAPIADFAIETASLAGRTIDASDLAPARPVPIDALTIVDVDSGEIRSVKLPPNRLVLALGFDPSARRFAVAISNGRSTTLHILDTKTARLERVGLPALNAAFGRPCLWFAAQVRLMCSIAVESQKRTVSFPVSPFMLDTLDTSMSGNVNPSMSTVAENAAAAFISQLVVVDVPTSSYQKLGQPGIYETFAPSPDGRFAMVSALRPPSEDLQSPGSIDRSISIWAVDGRPVASFTPTSPAPLSGQPRDVRWSPDAPSRLIWIEGDTSSDTIRRVESPSFVPQTWYRCSARIETFWWADGNRLIVREANRAKRLSTTTLVDDRGAIQTLASHAVDDIGNQFGTPVLKSGTRTTVQDGQWIFVNAVTPSSEGLRPYVATVNLATRERRVAFEASPGAFEHVEVVQSGRPSSFIIRRETPTTPPDYWLVDSANKTRRQLTFYGSAEVTTQGAPDAEILRYLRSDGVQLSARLYKPTGYIAGQRYPAIMWIYPQEIVDPALAGQVRQIANQYLPVSRISRLWLLWAGYAIIDNPTLPIIGPPESANDTYIEQLKSGIEAAVQAANASGVIDPQRMAIAGHSYGAFAVANVLAHTDLFKAGIALSGAYNRTLTPFGFQNEPRTLWQAPTLYARMSPFWTADKINEPLLLIHGERDPNTGTRPIQSALMFDALKANRRIARYVSLPYEGHNYEARESVLHVLAEEVRWLEKYLREKVQ